MSLIDGGKSIRIQARMQIKKSTHLDMMICNQKHTGGTPVPLQQKTPSGGPEGACGSKSD
jgi:hypothetical protein